MEFQHDHGLRIDAAVCDALKDCNGGKVLGSWDDWLRVGMRLGIRRIEFHDREVVPEPMLRYDDEAKTGAVLYLPYPRNRHELYLWLLHEFGEVAMGREVALPFFYPADWGDHHAMAEIVEAHHHQSVGTLEGIDAKIIQADSALKET